MNWSARYPHAELGDTIDHYHGIQVADPYRWLEDGDSPEVAKWVEAQNAISEEYLARTPEFEKIRTRLEELMNYERLSLPMRKGDRYLIIKNDGLQNQGVLMVQDRFDSEPTVLLDPNTLRSDGTVALTSFETDPAGRRLAYALSTAGSDSQQIRVRDIETGEDYPEQLDWCRFTSIAWAPDASGFFYNRFPAPGESDADEPYFHCRVCWHTVGTPQSEDRVIYSMPERKELNFSPIMTDDGTILALHVWQGTNSKNRFYYRETAGDAEFVRLLDDADAGYWFIGNVGRQLYFMTDLEAPNRRLIAIDIDSPERSAWKEILPEGEEVITSAVIASNQLVVVRMRDAHDSVWIHDLEGQGGRRLDLPSFGTIFNLSGRSDQSELFIGFTSYLHPATSYRYDFRSGTLEIFRAPRMQFDPSLYMTEQVFFESKDGTRVPMFIIRRRESQLDGSNPTLLYGYGGFGQSLTPAFSASWLLWLDMGGIVVMANLRGGGEYGDTWHKAGTLERKQNVFDDFIGAAEHLIETGYTSTRHLAIMGGSNGGLLVAVCMIQRPELFGSVVCQVPVIDMLRYHRFTVGHFWIPEYGNAESTPEHFEFLHAYSPLHNIDPSASYPPILIRTADHDDRVDPAHARKFAAALQAVSHGHAPVLLRVESRAGHGAGKPLSKVIEDQAETFSFLQRTIGEMSVVSG